MLQCASGVFQPTGATHQPQSLLHQVWHLGEFHICTEKFVLYGSSCSLHLESPCSTTLRSLYGQLPPTREALDCLRKCSVMKLDLDKKVSLSQCLLNSIT